MKFNIKYKYTNIMLNTMNTNKLHYFSIPYIPVYLYNYLCSTNINNENS